MWSHRTALPLPNQEQLRRCDEVLAFLSPPNIDSQMLGSKQGCCQATQRPRRKRLPIKGLRHAPIWAIRQQRPLRDA